VRPPTASTTTMWKDPGLRLHRGLVLLILLSITATNSVLLAVDPQDQEESCRNFTIGSQAINTFYSPHYPLEYPKFINCFRTITAEYGYFVRIDFRDFFLMEPPSNEGKCDYDYLEIRDGSEGYSTLIGKFCGSDFPPMITSSGRSLWLRFVSDGTIEYRGFKAVYNYISNPLESLPIIPKCEFEVSGSFDYIGSSNISEEQMTYAKKYGEPLDCTWSIRAEPQMNVSIFFTKYELDQPNDCNYNFIQIFDEKVLMDKKNNPQSFCGSVAAREPVVTISNIMYVRFFADEKGLQSEFVAYFTVMRKKDQDTEKCKEDEFDCDDTFCIDKSLVCNQVRNCKFGWDEDACGASGGGLPIDLSKTENIVIIVLLIAIMIGMCSGMIYNLIRKLSEDKEDVLASRDLKSLGSQSQSAASLDPDKTSKSRASRLTLDEDERNGGCFVPGPPDGGFPTIPFHKQ